MTFPNFVIAGAPKCGTSSLFTWLADHPDVCGSSVKETFFLMDADHPLRRKTCNVHDHGLEAYAQFFPHCLGRDRIVVEATTHYIYQATALDMLSTLPTKPRVLFLLRKPSERVFSSFEYSKNNLGSVAPDLSFADFVRLIRDDPSASTLRRALGPSSYVLSRDIQYSRYIRYLAAWRDRLGPDRIRIQLFESMRADPRSAMGQICSWLGIDDSFYDAYDFSARNRTVRVRSPRAQRIALTLAAKMSQGVLKNAAKRLYVALQRDGRKIERTAADKAALSELDQDFRSSNAKLAREFAIDLEAWK